MIAALFRLFFGKLYIGRNPFIKTDAWSGLSQNRIVNKTIGIATGGFHHFGVSLWFLLLMLLGFYLQEVFGALVEICILTMRWTTSWLSSIDYHEVVTYGSSCSGSFCGLWKSDTRMYTHADFAFERQLYLIKTYPVLGEQCCSLITLFSVIVSCYSVSVASFQP